MTLNMLQIGGVIYGVGSEDEGGWFGNNISNVLGNGKEIRFWKEKWLRTSSLHIMFSTLISNSGQQNGTISAMGSWDNDTWVQQHFSMFGKFAKASPSRKLVVRGKLHNTDGDTVHGKKLPPGYVKVTVEVALVEDAPLPIPVEDGDVSTIGRAIGTIVAWPFNLIEFVGECGKINHKLQKKDKKMQRSAESVASPSKTRKKMKNQETPPKVGDSNVSKNLEFLQTYVTHMWAAESVLEVSMGENVFGEEFSEHVHAEHLNEVLKHEWLNASVINIYGRYLYDKFIGPGGLTNKLSFLSPHESHDDVKGKWKDVHWALLVIDPDAGIIYFLDPMDIDSSRYLICKNRFENSSQFKIKWIRIKCPQQTNTTDCGYFVSRFMKEIVMQYPKKITDNYFDEYNGTYSKDKLDEMKDDWAEYMFTNVIPGGSWIK
ncbi:hypothetical protein TSUD_378720 [Trifolium subterraneum]|uniref:Ubiquitin-like protease family profile domain-containing protein n=1 Tax=Trifolium subterraneum TaxID=3900 RepID=A0A2Z6N569_TRISU|nr:hypothetical protein TSUD_378720 [Trifolium subterraneum]